MTSETICTIVLPNSTEVISDPHSTLSPQLSLTFSLSSCCFFLFIIKLQFQKMCPSAHSSAQSTTTRLHFGECKPCSRGGQLCHVACCSSQPAVTLLTSHWPPWDTGVKYLCGPESCNLRALLTYIICIDNECWLFSISPCCECTVQR